MESKGLAIVTGATRGIGFSISKGLAEDGYRVVLLARDIDALNKVRDIIIASKQYKYEPIILQADITHSSELDLKIKEIANQYGSIDILVNSAAMYIEGSIQCSVDDYRKIMETNVIAQFGMGLC